MFSVNANKFDCAALALSGLSLMGEYVSGGGNSSFIRGVQFYTIATCIDRLSLYLFAPEAFNSNPRLINGVISAFTEEFLYSGILLSTSTFGMIPRLAAALFTGMTAARTLYGRAEINPKNGFTIDTKIGFAWALAREAIIWSFHESYALPFLILTDSAVFALAELSPSSNNNVPVKYTSPWVGKCISAYFFRMTANYAALRAGLGASLTQHLLFNLSRSYP